MIYIYDIYRIFIEYSIFYVGKFRYTPMISSTQKLNSKR